VQEATIRGAFGAVGAVFLFLSCVTGGGASRSSLPGANSCDVAQPASFDRYERYLITAGAATEPMTILENDTPAGDAFLREKAWDVDPREPLLDHLAARMLETVKKASGVGIAGPQVGISRRVAWVQRMDKEGQPFEFYINPRITEFGPEKAIGWEGCLSIPAGFGQVDRSTWVVVEHETKEGKRISERIEGFTAVIFQHELDHLDGVLFIDRKQPGDLVPKEQYYEMRRREKEAKEAAEEKTETAPSPAPAE